MELFVLRRKGLYVSMGHFKCDAFSASAVYPGLYFDRLSNQPRVIDILPFQGKFLKSRLRGDIAGVWRSEFFRHCEFSHLYSKKERG